MVSHKYKCIFVHIPKAGGTSIEQLIWPSERDRTESNLWMGFVDKYNNKYQTGGLQHLFASQIQQELGADVFSEYFKFTMVRNPWDKIVSQFTYMNKRKDLREYIEMKEGDCFKTYLSLIQKKAHVQWEPQYKFFLDKNGDQIVDFIGRFENFNDEVHNILDSINVKTKFFNITTKKIPHSKKSIRSNYRDYYDEESREIVSHLYREDIEMLDYSF
jgi:hypothetical protein